jgi:hypothetical protein
LQRGLEAWLVLKDDKGVAIPLRGYVVCNSTPLRMPFWTAPPEGVFVRKMKLGICMGRVTGVFGGLCR